MRIVVASAFSLILVALPLAALAQGWTAEQLRVLADVNGDGRTDIVGFDEGGVLVALGGTDGAFAAPRRASTNFGSSDVAGGWRVDRHPRLVEDVNGDGLADIVGFGESAVRVALGQPDGTFSKPGPRYEDFYASSDGGGWSVERHPRLLGDVNGDGRLDIVGFGGRGVRVALGEAGGRFAKAQWVLDAFGWNDGWRVDRHPRLVKDVNGDGLADIVGFGESAVRVALGRPDGTFSKPGPRYEDFSAPSEGGGWSVERHPRLLGDVNGDGRLDIIGFGGRGVRVALGEADGRFAKAQWVLETFSWNDGWRVDRHPRLIADVNGDGRADIVGFGESAVRVALGQPDGTFSKPSPRYEDFSASSEGGGWSVERHPRLLGDVNGDGQLDIVGFGRRGVRVALGEADGRFAEAEWVLGNLVESVVARDCEPDEVKWITAKIPPRAPDKEYRVYVDCSFELKEGDVVYKRLILDPTASGVTIHCSRGAIIDGGPRTPNEDEEMVQIVSKQEGGVWKRPTNITIRDCEIIGRIRIWGMGRNGEAGTVRWSSRLDSNHVGRVRAAAPTNILLDNLTITSTGTALYLGPGVTFVSLINSELGGEGTRTAIYLDAESGSNMISNNYIHVKIFDEWPGGVFNRLGPQISLDASSENEIADNWFSALEGGGIYLYRNCGEGGTVRHGSSSYNYIQGNAFFYNRYDGYNPSVFVGSRGQWYRTISDSLGYCDDDENKARELVCDDPANDPIDPLDDNTLGNNGGLPPSCHEIDDFGYRYNENFPVGPFPWGSSSSNDDHATNNIIEGNQICKRPVGLMIRQGDSSNRPNVIRNNRTIPSGGTWRAGDYSGVC